MKWRRTVCMWVAALCSCGLAKAQVFVQDSWEQKKQMVLRLSELYGEVNVGVNVWPDKKSADFLYISMAYGKPTRRSPWRKFLPTIPVGDDLSTEEKIVLRSIGTGGVHAGMIGVGWNHWFNHIVGAYAQIGWGFIADLSSDSQAVRELMEVSVNGEKKDTFVYNTAPVEVGISLSMWKHLTLQGGVIYMWKEIPTLTLGAGYLF